MVSKRSSLDGRKMLWKEHTLRVALGVGISFYKYPTKEITMSTVGSKSSSSAKKCMGDNTT
jgi:hypothetical protein